MKPAPLALTTPSDRELLVTRSFNAPRALVWSCFTTPKLLQRWLLGPPGWAMPVCELDLRVGGKYRYVWRHDDGREMGMGGVFTEVAAPERLVSREKFDDDWTGGETTVTQVLSEADGVTTLRLTVLYASQEARDGAMRSGMTEGMEAGYARLDQVLTENPGA